MWLGAIDSNMEGIAPTAYINPAWLTAEERTYELRVRNLDVAHTFTPTQQCSLLHRFQIEELRAGRAPPTEQGPATIESNIVRTALAVIREQSAEAQETMEEAERNRIRNRLLHIFNRARRIRTTTRGSEEEKDRLVREVFQEIGRWGEPTGPRPVRTPSLAEQSVREFAASPMNNCTSTERGTPPQQQLIELSPKRNGANAGTSHDRTGLLAQTMRQGPGLPASTPAAMSAPSERNATARSALRTPGRTESRPLTEQQLRFQEQPQPNRAVHDFLQDQAETYHFAAQVVQQRAAEATREIRDDGGARATAYEVSSNDERQAICWEMSDIRKQVAELHSLLTSHVEDLRAESMHPRPEAAADDTQRSDGRPPPRRSGETTVHDQPPPRRSGETADRDQSPPRNESWQQADQTVVRTFYEGKYAPRKQISPERWGFVFSGEENGSNRREVSAPMFLAMLEANREAEGYNYATVLSYMNVLLVGAALTWWTLNRRQMLTAEDFVERFKDEFFASDFESNAYLDLCGYKQKDESVMKYLTAFHVRASYCVPYPDEKNLVSILKRNLRPEYQDLVAITKPTTVAQLKKECRDKVDRDVRNGAQPKPRRFEKPRGLNLVEMLGPEAAEGDMEAEPTEYEVLLLQSSTKPEAAPRKEYRCFNCDRLGHLWRRCPDKIEQPFCMYCGKKGVKVSTCDNAACRDFYQAREKRRLNRA